MQSFNRNIFSHNWSQINDGPLKKAGLLTRKIMRGSIRRATISKKTGDISQKPSKPGKPPKSRHPSHPFKKIFSLPSKRDVIIGHVGFGSKQTPMEMHEFGQQATIMTPMLPRRRAVSRRQAKAAREKFISGQIKSKKVPRVPKKIRMPKRPFAQPALVKAKSKLPGLWRNSVNKSTVRNK